MSAHTPGWQLSSIRQGFQIEAPEVFLPWGIRRHELLRLVPRDSVREEKRVLAVSCVALSGLKCLVLPRFLPRDSPPTGGALLGIGLERAGRSSPESSFAEFQDRLVLSFGPPTEAHRGTPEWPYGEYRWDFGDVLVEHYMEFNIDYRQRVSISRRPP